MPPPLPEDLEDLILLLLSPSEPASLVRAALVCKRWRRLISSAAFRRRFLHLHGPSPPMLGFVYRRDFSTRFMPVSVFCPPYADIPDSWRAVDARHGRILYRIEESIVLHPRHIVLAVPDPISGELRRMTTPRLPWCCSRSAAVLCAAVGCDHMDCASRGGPFIVAFAVTEGSEERTVACFYSSETGTWSKIISVDHSTDRVIEWRSAHVENAVYFIWEESNGILEYDLGKEELSIISLPSVCQEWFVSLMTAEDGGLGFAIVQDVKLCLWSRDDGPNGWVQRRVVELKSLVPACAISTSPSVIAFEDGDGVIFTFTPDLGVFAIDLISGRVTKICLVSGFHDVVPYRSFYFPSIGKAV